jgi:galactose mutarotase-like enzyme
MPETVRLEADGLGLTCHPGSGFVITAIDDIATGANALWTRAGFVPATFQRQLGQSGEASIETFVDLFVGGWFEMFPTTGYPGIVDGAVGPATSLLHGEVMRLPWTIIEQDAATIEATVTTLRTPFRLTRRIELDGGVAVIRERVENIGGTAAPYVWGHHPCFSRQTFRGGRFDLDVEEASVPALSFDREHDTLSAGADFLFPMAPTTGDGWRDVAAIPTDADGRHEQVTVRLRSGGVRITAPGVSRTFTLGWLARDLPYVLLWQDYAAPGAAFWGTCDTFAIEPSSAPGRSLADAVAADALRWLGPGETVSMELRASWGPLRI